MKSNFTIDFLCVIALYFLALVIVNILFALATKPASASIQPNLTHCVQIPDLLLNPTTQDRVSVKLICDDKGQQCELVEIIKLEPKTYFSPLSTECN